MSSAGKQRTVQKTCDRLDRSKQNQMKNEIIRRMSMNHGLPYGLVDACLNIPENTAAVYMEAADALPRGFWEAYSSLANTCGGIVVLGASEEGKLHVTGVGDVRKIVDDLWSTVTDASKVSSNVLTDDDIGTMAVDGKDLVTVRIPEADRRLKPVFVDGSMAAGTFIRHDRRNIHCSPSRLDEMIRDSQDSPRDDAPLREIPMDALESGTVRRYRARFASMNRDSALNALPDTEFLQALGAVGEIDGEKHPTIAGTLMFCDSLHIVKAFPRYLLDYREPNIAEPGLTCRISSMSPGKDDSLYGFYESVTTRVWNALPEPLLFDDMLLHRNDTELRKAVRELIANAIVHADYRGEMGIVIDMEPHSITVSNPGLFRIPTEKAVEGGRSDLRNPTLYRLFGFIGAVGCRGTGVKESICGLESSEMRTPVIGQSIDPSRTTVTVSFRKAVRGSNDNENKILELVRNDNGISLDKLSSKMGISRNKVYAMTRKLISEGKLAREGTARGGRWKVLD